MNPSIKNKVYIGYILAMFTLLVIAVLTYQNVERLQEVSAAGNKTHAVIIKLDNIHHNIKDIHNGVRNFILTGKESHLTSVDEALEKLNSEKADLNLYLSENNKNYLLIDTLFEMIERRIEFSDSSLNVYRNQGFNAAQQLIQTERGINLLQEIGRIISVLQNEELTFYKEYTAEQRLRAEQIFIAIYFGGGIAILFVTISLIIIKKDFAKLQTAEAELNKSEIRFRGTFEQAAVGIAHVSLPGKFMNLNQKFCEITGYSFDEMITKTFQEITHPDDLEADLSNVRQLLLGEIDFYSMEKRYLRKDGSIVWVELTVSLIRDKANHPDYFIAVVENISERKKIEHERAFFLEELKRSNTELEQFAYIASHDLQEPLRMVSSYTQLLSNRYKDKLDDAANDFINFATDGATRMQALINDLLDYSRIQTKGNHFTLQNSSEILAAAMLNLKYKIQESDAVINYENLPAIFCDSAQISRLMQNIIDNSIKFRGETKPEIKIATKEFKDEWRFEFRDNGIGINEKYKEKVFEIFRSLNNHKFQGTGIGLAVCKRIVERHCGKIWIESEVGIGTSVCFTISKKERNNGY